MRTRQRAIIAAKSIFLTLFTCGSFADATAVMSVVPCKKAHALDKKAYKKMVMHIGVTSKQQTRYNI